MEVPCRLRPDGIPAAIAGYPFSCSPNTEAVVGRRRSVDVESGLHNTHARNPENIAATSSVRTTPGRVNMLTTHDVPPISSNVILAEHAIKSFG